MKLKQLILSCLVIYGLCGCRKQEELPVITKSPLTNTKNPYTVSNMRKAFARILTGDIQLINNNSAKYARGKIMFSNGSQGLVINKTMTARESAAIAEKGINTSHYYIKFMPRNDQDMDRLKADTSLVIYPFPLDTEITPYRGNYRDPSVPAGVPTYQYAAVPVGYPLPDVPYQKLEDLFLPDEQLNSMVTVNGAGGSSFSVSARMLAGESMCGVETKQPINIEMFYQPHDDCDGGGGGGGTPGDPNYSGDEWRPHGRITVYDEVHKKIIGVEGIKVRAYRWFTTYTGITNANGDYVVDGWFSRRANYWLNFERYDFSVNDHSKGPREISGPKIRARWDVQFDGYDKFCSTIFRAAFHYYYKDIQGLRRPPLNSFWATQVKIGAFEGTHLNNTALGRTFLFGELIKIYTNPAEKQTIADLYATTIHELAHAVHWQMYVPGMGGGTIVSGYSSVEDRICESWSRGVQWVLTKMEYPDYVGGGTNAAYTNIIIDMIDAEVPSYPANGSNRGHNGTLDQVEGYTIAQIENALIGQKTWNGWRDNIKNLYNNGTEQHLDALFITWGN